MALNSQNMDIPDSLTSAAIVQQKLLNRLACPVTRGELKVLPLIRTAGAIKEALLWSPRLGAIVGEIKNYQIDFVRFHPVLDKDTIQARIDQGQLPSYETQQEVWVTIPPDNKMFVYSGDWSPIDDMVVTDCVSTPAIIRWQIDKTCRIIFGAHPWSGIVEVLVDKKVIYQIDLYEPHTTIPRSVVVEPTLPNTPSEILVRATGTQSAPSMGHQCLFSGCEIATGRFGPSHFEKKLRVRGASYSERFKELLSAVPNAGLCLDIGGGNRQIDDQRYVNLDYAAYEEPDVIGDALNLPFEADTFDLIYSTGVIEHLKDPIRAGKEIHRVTKSGGRALIGMAFLQPIHSEGQHFFNATIWGLQEVLSDFVILNTWWDGNLRFTIEWMLKCVDLQHKADPTEYQMFFDLLEKWDPLVSQDRLKYVASGVWVEAQKK